MYPTKTKEEAWSEDKAVFRRQGKSLDRRETLKETIEEILLPCKNPASKG